MKKQLSLTDDSPEVKQLVPDLTEVYVNERYGNQQANAQQTVYLRQKMPELLRILKKRRGR